MFHDICPSSCPWVIFKLHDSELPHAMIKTNGRPAGQYSAVLLSCLHGLFPCEENFLWLDKKKRRERAEAIQPDQHSNKEKSCLSETRGAKTSS